MLFRKFSTFLNNLLKLNRDHIKLVALSISFISFSLLGLKITSYVLFPYPINVVESFTVDQSWRVHNLQSLYFTNFDKELIFPTAYPPLYFYLVRVGLELFGTQFWFARLLSTMALTGTLFVLYKLLEHEQLTKIEASITTALALANPHFQVWGTLARVDMLGAFFVVLSVYLNKIKFSFLLTILFVILASWTKQSYLVSGIIINSALFVTRKELKKLATFLISSLAGFGAYYFLLSYLTKGGSTLHLFTLHSSSTYSLTPLVNISMWFYSSILLLPITIFAFLSRKELLFKLSLLAVVLYFTLSLAKLGSDFNYMIEPTIWIFFLIGVGYKWLSSTKQLSSFPYLVLLVLALGSIAWNSLCFSFKEIRVESGCSLPLSLISLQRKEAIEVIINSSENSLVDSEITSVKPLLNKRILHDPFMPRVLEKSTLWDYRKLNKLIEKQHFDQIALTAYPYHQAQATYEKDGNYFHVFLPSTYESIFEMYEVESENTFSLILKPKNLGI